MNEDILVEELPTDISSEEIILNINEVNLSVRELLEFLENEKKEQIEKEEKQKEEEKLNAPELKKEQEEKEQQQLEFIQNIETIATNTNSEVVERSLNDVSTLMQVNILTSGLLIGIICISLLFNYFKGKK